MQGSRYKLIVDVVCDWEPDLAGWTGEMVVRTDRTPDAPILATLSAHVSVLGAPANQAIIDIPANAPELAGVDWTEGVFDVSIAPTSQPERALRVIGGTFRLNLGVTT